MSTRKGFVLVATLWFVALLATVAVVALALTRSMQSTALAQSDDVGAAFRADACLNVAREILETQLREGDSGTIATGVDPWRPLVIQPPQNTDLPDGTTCDVVFKDVDAGFDFNLASTDATRRFLIANGAPPAVADSVAHWYVRGAQGEDVTVAKQIERFRPWLDSSSAELIVHHEVDRTNIHTAPPAVLMTLPGFSTGAVNAVLRRREHGRINTVMDISEDLAPTEANLVLANAAALDARVSYETTGVDVQITIRSPYRVASAVGRLIRTSNGAALISRSLQ